MMLYCATLNEVNLIKSGIMKAHLDFPLYLVFQTEWFVKVVQILWYNNKIINWEHQLKNWSKYLPRDLSCFVGYHLVKIFEIMRARTHYVCTILWSKQA